MSFNPNPQIEYFIVWSIIGIAGVTNTYTGFSACFEKKRSTALYFLYFMPKNIVNSWFVAAMVYQHDDPGIAGIWVTLVTIFAVLSFIVLWFTWDAEPLKIGAVGIVSDMISGLTIVIGAAVVNGIRGRSLINEFLTLSIADAFLVVVLSIAIYTAVIKSARRAAVWIRDYEIQHRKITTVAIIAVISMLSVSNLGTRTDINKTMVIIYVLGFTILLPLVLLSMRKLREQVNRQQLLKSREEMTEAYMLAIDEQVKSAEEHRQLLDDIKERAERVGRTGRPGENVLGTDMKEHIERLRAQAGELKGGAYSSSPAVDAILSVLAERIRAAGATAEFRASDIRGSEKEVADISMAVLGWAEASLTSKRIGAGKSSGGKDGKMPRRVRYEVLRRGNQLLCELEMTPAPIRKFPRSRLRGVTCAEDIVSETGNKDEYSLSIISEVGA